MKESVVTKLVLVVVFFCFSFTAPPSFGQFSGGSPAGVSAGLVKLFGDINGCVAKAEVRVLDAGKRETQRVPFSFALLDGKMRMDFDMAQIKSGIPASSIPTLKQAGLDHVASVVRPDRQLIYLMFPGARSYANLEFSKADLEATGKDLQVQKIALGKETVDGRSCTKQKVLVKNPKGAAVLEATTWNAADLREFPVQIVFQDKDESTVLHFNDVHLSKPPAGQFDPPKDFRQYSSLEALFFGASPIVVVTTNAPSSNPANSSAPAKATIAKPSTKTATKK